jgi:hypothetical protein
MSTDLWREAKVQDWIALCMSSGGLERHRWQEQGIMSFIWLLFTNTEELLQLEPPLFEFVHSRAGQDTGALCVMAEANRPLHCVLVHVAWLSARDAYLLVVCCKSTSITVCAMHSMHSQVWRCESTRARFTQETKGQCAPFP